VSRITRIVLLAAIALFAAAPVASATPTKKLDNVLAALWTTVLVTPSAQNPFGVGGSAFACFDLGGTVAPFVSVSALFDGAAITLFDGSGSRSSAPPGRTGMGSGNQRAIT